MPKHAVIVGSGLGGLSTAVILAKNGYRVTVLEQHFQVGGCLQCFRRGGVKFETGMHFIGSAEEGQTVGRLMRYLEMDRDVRLSPLDADGYDVISLADKTYRFAKGRDAFIRQMAEYFPHQRQELEHYFNLVEEIAHASSMHSLRHADKEAVINPEYQLRSINDVLEEVIGDPMLRNVLVGNLPLYAAQLDKTPFAVHAFIMDFYNQSAFRIVGGSEEVAKSLVATIGRYGGQVRTRAKVVHIECDETHATHVVLENGECIPCDVVISDAHPMRTLEWLDTHLIRPAFRKRVNAIPQTVGGFSLYLKFKHGAIPYMNHNFYHYNGSSPWGCEDYTPETWPKGYLYMHLCHEPHPVWAQSGVVLSYINYDDFQPWASTTVGHRGEDYEQFKHRLAERLLDNLERSFPGIRDAIEAYYTATPLTYRDYTGAERGGMYGIAKDVSMSAAYRVSQRTKVPNVLQTGQNINSHGMLGVLVGTMVTCSELVPIETIFNQIMEANRR